jgi:hypothetical protein
VTIAITCKLWNILRVTYRNRSLRWLAIITASHGTCKTHHFAMIRCWNRQDRDVSGSTAGRYEPITILLYRRPIVYVFRENKLIYLAMLHLRCFLLYHKCLVRIVWVAFVKYVASYGVEVIVVQGHFSGLRAAIENTSRCASDNHQGVAVCHLFQNSAVPGRKETVWYPSLYNGAVWRKGKRRCSSRKGEKSSKHM